MKKTINEHEFIDTFKSWETRKDQFSYGALKAIFAWYEDYEENTGEELELDVVATCCEFTEYESAWEAMQQYQPDDMPTPDTEGMDLLEVQEAQEQAAREWLEERTTVLDAETPDTDGGELRYIKSIVVMDF